MGLGDIIKSAMGGEGRMDSITDMAKLANIDLPLSGDAENMLGDLISKGVFQNKADFMKFIATAYMKNDIGSMMTGGKAPQESTIMDIITKSGIGKGYPAGDIKKMLMPLLMTAFFAVYKFMTKSKAAPPT